MVKGGGGSCICFSVELKDNQLIWGNHALSSVYLELGSKKTECSSAYLECTLYNSSVETESVWLKRNWEA